MNRYLAPIGVKICTMVHIGPGQVLSPFCGQGGTLSAHDA